MKAVLPPSLFLLWLLAGALPAQETAPPPQEEPAAAPAAPRAQVQVLEDGVLKPADALVKEPVFEIDDVRVHRGEPLRYVRRFEDVVRCDLGPVDVDADVLMVVDGDPVTREEFRRRAIMYLATDQVENALTAAITRVQLAKLREEGRDPDEFLVSEEEVDRKIQEYLDLIRLRARGSLGPPAEGQPDTAEEQVRQFLELVESRVGMEQYRAWRRAEASFEKVFLPIPAEATGEEMWDMSQGPPPGAGKPAWMPQLTWDAIDMNQQTARMVKAALHNAAATGTPIAPIFKAQFTSLVRLGVIQWMGLRFFFDEDLPEGVFLRVGQEVVRTDELWPAVVAVLADADIDLVLRELLTLRAMRRVLERTEQWLSDEAARAVFVAEEAKYAGTILPLRAIIPYRGYASVDRYREHLRYAESYRQWRRKSLSEEELEAHYREGGRLFFERGSVDLDIAYQNVDPAKPFALERFTEVEDEMLRLLAEGGFEAVQARFPAPPKPAGPSGFDPEPFYMFQRNPLRMFVTESELSTLISGYSLADDLIYHGEPGELFSITARTCRRHYYGNEANVGVWLVRAKRYLRSRTLAPMQAVERDQATQDFLDLNFLYWSQECLKALLPKVTEVTRP